MAWGREVATVEITDLLLGKLGSALAVRGMEKDAKNTCSVQNVHGA